jgi:flagellar assembly factor FliW
VNATEDTPPSPAEALHFPDGLPGFPNLKRFVLIEFLEDGAFQELQSLDDPEVSMIVCVPWLFFPDYAPILSDEEQHDLELHGQEDAVVFVPVTFDQEQRTVNLNLLGPFVVNSKTRKGRQLVLADSEYPARAPIELPSN